MSGGDDAGDAFTHVLYILIFLGAAWVAGKCASVLGMPPLVGEIILGALFGPPLGNKVPYPDGVALLGEVGLVLMVCARVSALPRSQAPCGT
jgi:Kef-type K+ transport system membrane component KefB